MALPESTTEPPLPQPTTAHTQQHSGPVHHPACLIPYDLISDFMSILVYEQQGWGYSSINVPCPAPPWFWVALVYAPSPCSLCAATSSCPDGGGWAQKCRAELGHRLAAGFCHTDYSSFPNNNAKELIGGLSGLQPRYELTIVPSFTGEFELGPRTLHWLILGTGAGCE